MSRLMSVAMTTPQVRVRTKTVSRRANWWNDKNDRPILRAGDKLTLCPKVQGRRPGEAIERLAEVTVVDVRREPLIRLLADPVYGAAEMIAEGFPGLDPEAFIRKYFENAQRIGRHSIITRIEWRYPDTDAESRHLLDEVARERREEWYS